MSTLLRIDSSSRHDGSWSRRFGDEVAARLKPGKTIVRDLTRDPLPHIPVEAIAAFFSDPAGWTDAQRAAAAVSDQALAEIAAADDILITVTMYNFAIPSALKAWIDHIVRIGKTFSFDGKGFDGLVKGKRAFVVIAYGADGYTDGDFKSADFVAPYLRFILGFIGVSDVTIVPVEGMNMGKADLAEQRARAVIDAIDPTAAAV
jgi:FMN-dependent NADH-azoreductase